MSVSHKKARSFTFIDQDDALALSIVTEDGVHQYIDLTPTQGCLAGSQLAQFMARYAKKGVESKDILPPCDVG